MNTLTDPAVASLLERLYRESEVSIAPVQAEFARLTAQERLQLMSDKANYREFYTRMQNVALPVSPDEGRLLYMLARNSRAKSIVEFGMSFAVSTIHLAAAVKDNGGGSVLTTEFEPNKVRQGRTNLIAANLLGFVEIREGDALQTLSGDLPEEIDLLVLDGAKSLYHDILRSVELNLRRGALVFADNAEFCPDFLAAMRSEGSGYLSVPVGEAELFMKI